MIDPISFAASLNGSKYPLIPSFHATITFGTSDRYPRHHMVHTSNFDASQVASPSTLDRARVSEPASSV